MSKAAFGFWAAGLAVALADFAADSNAALVDCASAAEALAPLVAIRRLKPANRELAAPKRWSGASTGQSALNPASTWCIRLQTQSMPVTAKR